MLRHAPAYTGFVCVRKEGSAARAGALNVAEAATSATVDLQWVSGDGRSTGNTCSRECAAKADCTGNDRGDCADMVLQEAATTREGAATGCKRMQETHSGCERLY
eukprot:6200771-Pleurochrysis_carterae.AAC.1